MENLKAFISEVSKINLKEPCFLLLDNGSDQSLIEGLSSNLTLKDTSWEIIRTEKNLAFGGGILFAAKHIKEDFVCWMPGNMKVKPSDAVDLITKKEYKDEKVLVKAKRINRPLLDFVKTKIFGLIASVYFNKYMYDMGGTPNIMSKKLLLKISNPPKDFSFDAFIYYFAKLNNIDIQRPKISYTKRLHGKSHWQNGLSSELYLTKSILSSKTQWKKVALEHKRNKKC